MLIRLINKTRQNLGEERERERNFRRKSIKTIKTRIDYNKLVMADIWPVADKTIKP